MLDLSQFSNLLSSLSSGLYPGLRSSGNSASPSTATPAATALPSPLQDILDLSPASSNQLSGGPDSTNGVSAAPAPVTVTNSGTYRPSGAQTRLGASLNFSFNMSLQQATVIQRSAPSAPPPPAPSAPPASQSSQFAYRALRAASARNGSYSEVRRFQTDLFFSRTRTLSKQLSPGTGQHLESSGQQVAKQFQINISLDFSFLQQFNTQTKSLSGNENTLNQYLDGVDSVGKSGDALKAFFDQVDNILSNTQGFVQDTLGSFLTDVKAAFGLSDSDAQALTSAVTDQVTAFFKDVGSFLDEAQKSLSGLYAPAAPPAAPPAASPPPPIAPPKAAQPDLVAA